FKCRSGITPEYVHRVAFSVLAGEKLPVCRSIDDVIADLLQAVAPKAAQLADTERLLLSSCIARSLQPTRKRQLFFDISELLHRDAKTGIQRVVRSVLNCLLAEPPADFDVVVVYANNDQIGYRQLNDFQFRFMNGLPLKDSQETLIDYHCGDVFFSLDLAPAIVVAQRDYLQNLRIHGVRVFFAVHDILFISLAKYFDDVTAALMKRWLQVVSESDGVICVSQTTANKVSAWLATYSDRRELPLAIGYFHLGADINASLPTKGLPDAAEELLKGIAKKPSFLMVGTLEPRKGHSQALAAFESLWGQGLDVNLVIVGKAGWLMEPLLGKICGHVELNKRLFWLEGISDEYLEKLYTTSTCLIAASEGEGFGLPLIEAAQHKLPIIARDLPVFHEVAGKHAYYFNGLRPADIADAVTVWLKLNAEGKSPQSANMPWQTWRQSTRQLLAVLSVL
ncbi:MAG: glycosyltransferase family 1 protein, partial [Methylovulum sp.]|nr:glycosyltransferase family 1 protein [Methylovulum sp.]